MSHPRSLKDMTRVQHQKDFAVLTLTLGAASTRISSSFAFASLHLRNSYLRYGQLFTASSTPLA